MTEDSYAVCMKCKKKLFIGQNSNLWELEEKYSSNENIFLWISSVQFLGKIQTKAINKSFVEILKSFFLEHRDHVFRIISDSDEEYSQKKINDFIEVGRI